MKRQLEPAPDFGVVYTAECDDCGHSVRKRYAAPRFVNEPAECEVCAWNAREAGTTALRALRALYSVAGNPSGASMVDAALEGDSAALVACLDLLDDLSRL